MEKHGLQGISLAITQGDQIVYLKGYGTAGEGRPMTPQTPMYIGSQSKSITALAIAQLAEQGKVDLSAPVRRYIPWFAVADPDSSQKITVNDLLHHTSGLSEAGYTAVVPEDATLAQGYSRFFGFTVPWPQPHVAYQLGDGYMISSAEDMAHFAIAMNNQGSYRGTSVISPDMLRTVFSPVQGYGMGWFIEPGHIYHGGANETFKTFVDLYPDRGLGIVLLINQGYMMDHFISAPQVFKGVEAIVLGSQPPAVSAGWSVKVIGWGLLALVLGLCALHAWNIYHLRGWSSRVRQMTPVKRAVDVAISFIIPTVILLVVYTQVKGFIGYRFNLTYQVLMMFKTLPDISILMLVGTLPDYAQGLTKL